MTRRQIIRLEIEVEVESDQDAAMKRDEISELVRDYDRDGTIRSVTADVVADSANGVG